MSPGALVETEGATGSPKTFMVTDAVYAQPPPGVVASKVISAPFGIVPGGAL